jgi:hypothetical protein
LALYPVVLRRSIYCCATISRFLALGAHTATDVDAIAVRIALRLYAKLIIFLKVRYFHWSASKHFVDPISAVSQTCFK